MRIDSVELHNHPPIADLSIVVSSSVVIIAGANGSGKTRLKDAIVATFRKPQQPQVSLTLTATRSEEEQGWGKKSIQVSAGQDSAELRAYLSTRTKAQAYTGTAVQIDSDRAVRPVQFESFTLATEDPDDQDVSYSWYLSPFVGRWQELVNKIYKKTAARDQKIARFVKASPSRPGADALTEYPDPFAQYRDVFAQLLPGKTLEPIDPRSPREFHYRIGASTLLPFSTLSSGEQEVVKVAFDLVWKRITHSIILIDEPELHLHPTLAFRLIETLRSLGGGTNQLVLFTHSADLLSTYYTTGGVFFLDASPVSGNQAHQLSAIASAHSEVARAAGANLGLFAVGKRLVFVEGREASVDRLIYHRVAQLQFPDSHIVPLGSVENLVALRTVIGELTNTVFGIELFLVRDRDGLTDDMIATLESNPRFRALPRRHVENYLLDEGVLSEVAKALYLAPQKQDVVQIRDALRRLASASIMQSVLWHVREIVRIRGTLPGLRIQGAEAMSADELAGAIAGQLSRALLETSQALDSKQIRGLVVAEHMRLQAAVASDAWQTLLPGKLIFGRFCGDFFGLETARVREAYVDIALRIKPAVFDDVAGILRDFARIAATASPT